RLSKSKKKWLCCWACRCPATRRPDGRRGGPAARPRADRRGLRGAGSVARQLPSPDRDSPAPFRPGPSAPSSGQGAGPFRASGRPRSVARTSVRRPTPGGSLRRVAGPRPLSLLDPDHVSHPPRERRGEGASPTAAPPHLQKPELIAEGPNQVWSWDITKLMGPAKWTYFYLYAIIDIFSRRVVAWLVAAAKHGVLPSQLTLHADRGPSMKAKATALLLADLGVTKSHSRPYTSNDNP